MKKKNLKLKDNPNLHTNSNVVNQVSHKSFFEEESIQRSVFLITTSAFIGAFLGGQQYGVKCAFIAALGSVLDIALKHTHLTSAYYFTGSMLGAMGALRDYTNNHHHISEVLNVKSAGLNTDSTLLKEASLSKIFNEVNLIKHVSSAVCTGVLGALTFSWSLDWLGEFSNHKQYETLPYKDVRNTVQNSDLEEQLENNLTPPTPEGDAPNA